MSVDEPEPSPTMWVNVVGIGVLCLSGLLSAVLEVLFIPLYAGSVVVPVAVLGAIVGNVVLPRLAGSLDVSTRIAALPFVAWLLVVLVAVLLPRPEGDILLPGGSLTWVTYGVLLGGTVAGAITLAALSAPPMPKRPPAPGSTSPSAASRPARRNTG